MAVATALELWVAVVTFLVMTLGGCGGYGSKHFFRMFNGYRYGIYKKNLGVNPICSQDQMIICAPSSTFFLRDTCMCGLNSG